MAMMSLMICASAGKQVVPAPVTTLEALRKAVLDESKGRVTSPVWSLTRPSWNAPWGQSAFGVREAREEDAGAFGFRVPPDSGLKTYAGGSPFLVEGYRDGFPTFGVRRNGDWGRCRPLGFV